MTMPIDHLPDWELRLARQDAFWHKEIIDRPVVTVHLAKTNPEYPWPAAKSFTTLRERWMDADYHAERALASVMNTDYLGDSLPYAMPNFGPEIFSAFFGCQLEFGETTAWSIPNLTDWMDVDTIKFSEENCYWKKMLELTDALLEVGKGKFYTGITDLHPGADAMVAFRDPQGLNIDMIESVDAVKSLLRYVTDTYFQVYDFYHAKLTTADQAICSWPGIVSTKKWYVPSNDFSCMISQSMFDEIFLPGIAEECRHMEANIYHLDGPNALRHLDSLLAIPELNAIQWVCGEGNGRASDWLPIYMKCQQAGKGVQIFLGVDEIDLFIEYLKPNGVWLGLRGVQSREQAEGIIKKLLTWK